MTVLQLLAESSQFVLQSDPETLAKKPKGKPHPTPIVKHELYLLPVFALLSAVVLFLCYAVPKVSRFVRRRLQRNRQPIFLDDDVDDDDEPVVVPPQPVYLPSRGLWSDFKAHFRSLRTHGTITIALELLRFFSLCALLGLSIYATILAESPDELDRKAGVSGDVEIMKKKKKHKKKAKYSHLEYEELGVSLFYAYNLFLSFLLLTNRPSRLSWRLVLIVDILLLGAMAMYAHRDIWPALTTYLTLSDRNTWVTWTRIGILGVASLLLPSLRPRIYVPVDPNHPTPEDKVHPEQTAPPLFYLFFEYMTPLVRRAWKTTSLPYDQLQPLADYDRAEYLYQKHIADLDPIRRREKGLPQRHLLFTLLWTFRWPFAFASLMCVVSAVAEFAPTVAIQQILYYLETEGRDATIRPIVWVVLLFVGPTIYSLGIQFYVFVATRCLVRGEAVLTQLIFDHALRLRMKDKVKEDNKKSAAVPDILVDTTDDQTETPASADGEQPNKASPSPGTDKSAKGQGMAGRINVLMAQDVQGVVDGRDIALLLVYHPIQLMLCVVFLYRLLSWSSLFGVATVVIALPLPGFITKLATVVQAERMEATDVRVDEVTEAVGALRIIKMFGWEDRIKTRIANKREDELQLSWKRRILNLSNDIINLLLPVITMTVSFAAYTLIQKRELTASIVFTSMAVFELLKGQLFLVFFFLREFVTSGVSLQRINDFLHESDLIDSFSQANNGVIQSPEQLEAQANGLIRLHDATFAWGEDSANKNIINFRLRVPDVTFAKGKLNLITGPTGSGKSTLLKALIGELHFEPREGSFFHLPREGGVSYAAQESWCLSASIRDNILFGRPYDEERYLKVIHDCALETDLTLFDDGDETEIGEKGVTLSGGQKARITLARAIYVNSEVVLLDDIFSALDTLTSRFILDNLFRGDLVKDRTILLVTHHLKLATPVASFVLRLAEDGQVAKAGPIDLEQLSASSSLSNMRDAQDDRSETSTDTKVDPLSKKKDEVRPVNKLVKEEEKSEGRISRRALLSFFSTFGGSTFWIIFWALLVAGQAVTAFQSLWLGWWSKAYTQVDDPSQVDVVYWLGLYVVWVLVGIVALACSMTLFFWGSMKASRTIHAQLVNKIFGSYMRFLDSTPIGRIIGRFTRDIKSIDGGFPETAQAVFDTTISLIIKLISVVIFVPFFSLPAIAIGVLGGVLGELYIHAQLSVKREMSNAKTPLFSHLASAVSGIVSIRAYAAQDQIRDEVRMKTDKYTRAATAFFNLNRWITIRVDMLGGLFSAALAAFLIYGSDLDPATSGFALSQAIAFSYMILWWVRLINEMEVEGNAVERIEDYLVIDQEPASEDSKKPPAAWPTSGELVLNNLCAKYSSDGPIVLDNLSVRIKSGQKVGIVGRTGSGKSTFALALLRMIPTSGSVLIDGQRIDKINLHDLRSHVTIIPQDPILLSGSLRFNLDPFDEHNDEVLNDALERSGLGLTRRVQGGTATPRRITLDTLITVGGSNLSQGQRQLVALARALVRDSKVLILDEATASVDFETDTLIQKSIRNLPPSTTVLTVAHRLSTVMDYDRIMVLGAGKLLEFDSPEALKNNPDSYFAKLVGAMEGGANM